jgi:hypothetical protein
MKKFIIIAIVATSSFASADFTQNFEDITAMTDWSQINLSNPVGSNGWLQGEDAIFAAESGSVTSYAAANFTNTAGNGSISNWLITEQATLSNGSIFSFFTRTVDSPFFPDRLEVRMSTAGNSTDVGTTDTSVGDFTTLLLTVNPDLTSSGYPNTWTQYNLVLSGLATPTTGRFAFRYSINDAGPSAGNGDYIGVDTVSYTEGVPEPATMAVLGGLALAAIRRKRK